MFQNNTNEAYMALKHKFLCNIFFFQEDGINDSQDHLGDDFIFDHGFQSHKFLNNYFKSNKTDQ